MKIVDIAEFYSEQGGGVRTYIDQKLEYSAYNGHHTVIIAPGAEDREELRPGGKIIWVRGRRIPVDPRYFLFSDPVPIYKILDREAPDVVEGSSPWKGGWIAAKWRGPAVRSFFVHADPVAAYPQTFLEPILGKRMVEQMFAWFWRYLERLSRLYDTSVVAGSWLADRFAGYGLRRPHAIPLGIQREIFSPLLRRETARLSMLRACGIENPNAKLLITVSRHHPEKRLGTLIKAVSKGKFHQQVGLYVIGDGPDRRRVERLANKAQGVFVAGQIKDRPRLAQMMASADAMLHGSASETFGIVVGEALCSGLPIIVPDIGGAADLARPAYAETYKAGNVEACQAAIGRLLQRSPEELRKAALGGAASHVHSPDEHFKALFDHYAALINAPVLHNEPAFNPPIRIVS
ncbi:MAG: glycosyl transferase family 1 [Robiginitomaculum sp.]|nr:MAG: glycosyl transferase family 1 [Robiginitomaculum sp.]